MLSLGDTVCLLVTRVYESNEIALKLVCNFSAGLEFVFMVYVKIEAINDSL